MYSAVCVSFYNILMKFLKLLFQQRQLITYFTTLLLQHYMSTTDTLSIVESLSGFIVQRVQSLEEEYLHW